MQNHISEFLLELANIGVFLGRPIVQLQDGTVMGVRGNEEKVFDADALEVLADDGQ